VHGIFNQLDHFSINEQIAFALQCERSRATELPVHAILDFFAHQF
jgi:ABC-type sulfate/molybdate transport systems ATPase subunit